MEQILNCGFLLMHTVTDIRKKKILIWPCILYFIAGICRNFCKGGPERTDCVMGILVGILLFLTAGLTKQAIGYGDCLVLSACGAMAGASESVVLLFLGSVIAALWAGLLLLMKKTEGSARLPFLPFLFAAQVILLII